MNPLGKLVLALSSLLLLSAAIVTSESALLLRIGFLLAAVVGAVWSVVLYKQDVAARSRDRGMPDKP